jgi:cytidylate kinase
MIVTIDGPAGAGKSSTARALAERLGFAFLDTGAMFRAVAWFAQQRGIAWHDDLALEQLLGDFCLEMPPGGGIFLLGQNISQQIRTSEVSQGASVVAASPAVRPRLASMQRQIAQGGNIVCEGRDQGTVVFPDAGCKFFLTADPEERLRRRARELEQRGRPVDLDMLRREMIERDQRDAARALAPLRAAVDAIILDSTHQTAEEVLHQMETEVRRRLS